MPSLVEGEDNRPALNAKSASSGWLGEPVDVVTNKDGATRWAWEERMLKVMFAMGR